MDFRTDLYFDIDESQWPIIYRPEYNVHFLGLQKLHPFDAGKWGHIFEYLKEAGLVNKDTIVQPNEATKEDLLIIHTAKYIKSLKCSINVASIAEILPLCIVPNFLVQSGYLRPMRFQTGGSVLAGKLALERGWAINIGGGFHHCSSERGGGFCPYADITLLIQFLFNKYKDIVKKVMIIDLDAHQGNGYEMDFRYYRNVYIMDVYNKEIYPCDYRARTAIKRRVELSSYTKDEDYLRKVLRNLEKAFEEFIPDLIVYNAGTDVLEGDTLGRLSVSPQGIIRRDEIVFKKAQAYKTPIVMLTSGGYLKKTANIIANSIINLHQKGLIKGPKIRY